jgi:hypothetical protein
LSGSIRLTVLSKRRQQKFLIVRPGCFCFNPKKTYAASVYYTFTGPITLVGMYIDYDPQLELFYSDQKYFKSGQYYFIKSQIYGNINYIIEIDMSKAGAWTDSEGKINYFPDPMDLPYYYANYISGSLTKNTYNYEFFAKNNYIWYSDSYLEIHVSYFDSFITLSNYAYDAHPDPGFGFNINQAFSVYGEDGYGEDGGDWVLLTKISNTAPVPEPTTLFLLAFGLIGAIGLKRELK